MPENMNTPIGFHEKSSAGCLSRPILALDCGSTNFKAAIFSNDLRRLAETSAPLPYLAEEPDRTELDPTAVWECARSVLAETLRQAGLAPRHRPRLALTSQAQTFAVFSNSSASPLSPFLSWRDGRARDESVEIQRWIGAPFATEAGFPKCIPHLMAPKLLWMLRHITPQQRASARVMSLPGFIAWKWAGLNAIDPNLAGMSGLFSIPENGWNKRLLQHFDLRSGQLPRIVPFGRPCPGLLSTVESGSDPEIVFAGNDQTAGAFGNDCSDDHPLITLGTALVAYRIAGSQPGPYPGQGIWGPYPDGRYYELVTSNQGCAALDWACRHLAPSNPNELLKDTESHLISNPRPDLQSPFFFPHRSGSPQAWTGPSNPMVGLGAVLEGIAFELKHLMDSHFPPFTSNAHFQVCGGGSRSDVWLQMIASLFNRPVIRASGDALTGAARSLTSTALPALVQNARFLPDPLTHPLYARRFNLWLPCRTADF